MNDNWRDAPPSIPPAPRSPGAKGQTQNLITAALVVVGLVIAFFMAKQALVSGLLFAFILIALVLAHEAAHFATAKMFGIRVHEFGVGFPPKIGGKWIGDTEYTINWLPIGGFVRLADRAGVRRGHQPDPADLPVRRGALDPSRRGRGPRRHLRGLREHARRDGRP
jgi:hypothetical protein